MLLYEEIIFAFKDENDCFEKPNTKKTEVKNALSFSANKEVTFVCITGTLFTDRKHNIKHSITFLIYLKGVKA